MTSIREIRQLLRQLADRGTSVFVSSHQLSELEQVSDQLVLLHAGRLAYQGPLAGLLPRRTARITAKVAPPGRPASLARLAERQGWAATVAADTVTASAPADAAGQLNQLAHPPRSTTANGGPAPAWPPPPQGPRT